MQTHLSLRSARPTALLVTGRETAGALCRTGREVVRRCPSAPPTHACTFNFNLVISRIAGVSYEASLSYVGR